MPERRTHARRPANVVVNITTGDRKDRVGVTSDVSPAGIVVHSQSKFVVGERMKVVFRAANVETHALGRVVRTTRDPAWQFFPNVTAIEFERPQPHIVSEA